VFVTMMVVASAEIVRVQAKVKRITAASILVTLLIPEQCTRSATV